MNLVKHGMMYKKITRGTLNIYREIMFEGLFVIVSV